MSIEHEQMNYFDLKTNRKTSFAKNSKNGEHITKHIWDRKRTKNK